ncbi:Laccase domain protein YfiH [Caloramator mitchellensis]|uniref:Purine nucleoside phosphorylase n=1 Tax=Caloramator mitchellensis TaxID=908809 RepID=A0A0R3JW76_CALMK|nr:peptidoglycan editing factor PgeF [Caloramator mitchellensis]KRQ86573.1 Laccase domain protein YfiH [Caloramator mitchellensis]
MTNDYLMEDRGIKNKLFLNNVFVNHLHSNAKFGLTMSEYEHLIESGQLSDRTVSAFSDFSIKNFVFLRQVHSNEFYVVDKNNKDDIKGKMGDAIICIDNSIPLLIFTADCVPVFLVDLSKKYIAAIHAGWRGTNLKISQKVAKFMIESLNSRPGDILASIGPSIGSCCYDVSLEVATKFNFFYKDEKYYVDLWREIKYQLLEAGLSNDNIFVSGICTYCNDLFYSYRKIGKDAGRQINIIEIKG